MIEFDAKHFAEKILNLTKTRSGNDTYPLPVKHLRNLALFVLQRASETPDRPPLTDVERSVLQAIKQDNAQGIQPTIRSIQARLEYASPSSVQAVVDRLIKMRYIKRSGSRKQIVVINGNE